MPVISSVNEKSNKRTWLRLTTVKGNVIEPKLAYIGLLSFLCLKFFIIKHWKTLLLVNMTLNSVMLATSQLLSSHASSGYPTGLSDRGASLLSHRSLPELLYSSCSRDLASCQTPVLSTQRSLEGTWLIFGQSGWWLPGLHTFGVKVQMEKVTEYQGMSY